ncbi:hypothetical protein PINS_up006751 [Pythium insidiosum]|nr:hypothetical protein PINS_up006751 [Pythium insidiosum]
MSGQARAGAVATANTPASASSALVDAGTPPVRAPPSQSTRQTTPRVTEPAWESLIQSLARVQPNAQRLYAGDIHDEEVLAALAVFCWEGQPSTLLNPTGSLPLPASMSSNSLLQLMCEPGRVFQQLAKTFGTEHLDIRANNTATMLRRTCRFAIVAASQLRKLATALEEAKADCMRLSAAAASTEDRRRVEEAVRKRGRLEAELARSQQMQAELRQQIIDERDEFAKARQVVSSQNAQLSAELASVREELETTKSKLTELQSRLDASMGTVDEVADFWLRHAKGSPSLDPAALRFALEACRQHWTQDWEKIMFVAAVWPSCPTPSVPASATGRPPATGGAGGGTRSAPASMSGSTPSHQSSSSAASQPSFGVSHGVGSQAPRSAPIAAAIASELAETPAYTERSSLPRYALRMQALPSSRSDPDDVSLRISDPLRQAASPSAKAA